MAEFFINLVVFILSLGLLVVIHEFGHFITAKIFNVYVTEFSIGFGPALFTRKKENKETRFSIRAVPLGGYCAMVGEDLPEFSQEEYEQLSDKDKELVDLYKKVPSERRLDGIARWKRAIVFVAGVTLNFILGYIILFGYNISTPFFEAYNNQVNVIENSIADKANWKSEDIIREGSFEITLYDENNEILSQKNGTLNCVEDTHNLYKLIDNLSNDSPKTANDVANFTLITTNDKVINFSISPVLDNESYYWPQIGIEFYPNYDTMYRLNFGEAIVESGKTFGSYSVAIFKGLGMLFTAEGFEQTGGVIAIFQVQQQLMERGVGYVVNLWAMISINLGIMNLLPFPGLDGWHLLVNVIEGITRKELPKKVKTIVSNVGMILLFGLMIVITFKDIFNLF